MPTCMQPPTSERTMLRAKASATMVKHSRSDSAAGVRYRSPMPSTTSGRVGIRRQYAV